MKIADFKLEWATIAEKVDISERQLRRVRQTPEWKEYWDAADKETMIEHLRKAAVTSQNAALYKTYFEVTGTLDPDMLNAMMGMTDEEFMAEAQYIVDWFNGQGKSSQGTDEVSLI